MLPCGNLIAAEGDKRAFAAEKSGSLRMICALLGFVPIARSLAAIANDGRGLNW